MREGGRVERQTDRCNNMTKLIVALRNFAKASKNEEANTVRVTIFYCNFCDYYNWYSQNRPISHTL